MKRNLAVVAMVLLGLMVGLAGFARAEEGKGTIIVTAVGFKGDKGQAVVALYKRGSGWLDLSKAYKLEKVAIKDGKISVKFKDLPFDQYGVTVLHDQNLNNKMDMQWLPYPKPEEGGGVSNNFVRSGKPEYDKAKFDLSRALMSVRITIFYQ
jgi:uncharacterized protein (DUF2141 family)